MGSKGYLGAIAIAYILFWYLTQPDDASLVQNIKRLSFFVFAGQREQAIANQWGDIMRLVRNAPCFGRYSASDPTADRMLLYSHDQLVWGRCVVAGDCIPHVQC